MCNKEAFPATPKVCLVFAKIVSPLREKPILFPDPGSRVPYCQQSGPPLPGPGACRRTTRRGGRFFQTVIVKPRFGGLGRENQALVFIGCNPDPPKENLGGKTATSPTSPSTAHSVLLPFFGAGLPVQLQMAQDFFSPRRRAPKKESLGTDIWLPGQIKKSWVFEQHPLISEPCSFLCQFS